MVYESFIEAAPPTEPGLEMARGRIEALRQELKELRKQRAMEQDEQLSWFRRIDEKLQVVIDLLRQERLAPRTQQKQTALQPQ